MAKILMYPNSILSKPCETVGDLKVARQIADELLATMKTNRRASVGLSAPQIGRSLQVFAMDTKYLRARGIGDVRIDGVLQSAGKCPNIFVNPVVTWRKTHNESMDEGCMSFPTSVLVSVSRPVECTVEALTSDGRKFTADLRGFASRVALHEIDHLNGVTILDYTTGKKKQSVLKQICVDIKKIKR